MSIERVGRSLSSILAGRPALRYGIEAALRRPWHVLVPAALVLAAGVTVGWRLPPRYRAAALILGEWDRADEPAMQKHGIDVAKTHGQAVRERIRDRAAIERMLQRLELGLRDQAPTADEVARWRDVIDVRPTGANAFLVECVLPDASRAALVANLLAHDLIEQAQADAVQWRAAEAAARLGRGTAVRFELLRWATVPDSRDSQGLLLFALAGGGLGLAVGLVAAILAEMRDRTVKGPEDLAELPPWPLLATIPLVRKGRTRGMAWNRRGGVSGRRGRGLDRGAG